MSNVDQWKDTQIVVDRIKNQIAEERDWVHLEFAIDYFGVEDSRRLDIREWEEAIRRLLSTGELFLRFVHPTNSPDPIEKNPVEPGVTPRQLAVRIATDPDLYLLCLMLDAHKIES
ncbi:hypothetical protein GSS88_11290 [Corynebacterium sp. 3HC-13]|uniref:LLM class flavin-dependent oxidoreductase n=1 Tax=Corynebacterium poyangense TaxID=2684405 RepID=UPI001CC9D988|nr:LLM class flavin-dependent oxidoreductase [Corynebacterium poyangense]MBZ8178361.1 hypothetical protein [Corynebacterium poyangense]